MNNGHITTQNMADDMDPCEVAEMREVFDFYDQNKDGWITGEELESVMNKLGQNPRKSEVERHINEGDLDGDGRIDFPEFLTMMSKAKRNPRPEEKLRKAFDIFDQDKNGFISREELQRVMQCLGDDLDDNQLDAMMKEADTDGDGQVNFEEFKRIMMDM